MMAGFQSAPAKIRHPDQGKRARGTILIHSRVDFRLVDEIVILWNESY